MSTSIAKEEEPKWIQFEVALAGLINHYSMEQASNTPDYILARYLLQCLRAYESIKRSNDEWHKK